MPYLKKYYHDIKLVSALDGFTMLKQAMTEAGSSFLIHKPNTDMGDPVYFTLSSGANNVNTEPYSNYVFAIGINLPGRPFAPVLQTRGGMAFSFESLYDQIGPKAQEMHFVHFPTPNTFGENASRIFTCFMNEDGSDSNFGFNVGGDENQNAFYINKQDLTPKVKLDWNNDSLNLMNNMKIIIRTNNIPAITQNTAGDLNSIILMKLNANNETEIHNGNYIFKTGNIIHTNGGYLQLGEDINPIHQGAIIVASAQSLLLKLKRSDMTDLIEIHQNANSYWMAFGTPQLIIDKNAPTNMLYVAQNMVGIGGNPSYGKLCISGQQSSMSIALNGVNGGDCFYFNGSGTNLNIFRFDVSMSNKLKMPIINSSSAANSTVEVNLASGSSTGKNYVSYGNNESGNGWQTGCDRAVDNNYKVYQNGDKMTGGNIRFEVLAGGGIAAHNLKVAADDTAAGVAGAVTNEIYKTSTGELRIKL